jgi:mRNA interferase MazF
MMSVKNSKKQYKKGDIVLVPFPFTDLEGQKLRPAVVLGKNGDSDYIFCFISSQNNKVKPNEIKIQPDSKNNLKTESKIISSKICTLDQKVVIGQLGILTKEQIDKNNKNLRKIFSL